MAKSDAVTKFLTGVAAACKSLGYPSWVDRELLSRHLVTADRILDGASPTADETQAMAEFAEIIRVA